MNLDMVVEYFSSDSDDNKLIDELISVSKDSITLYKKNDNDVYQDIDL